MGFGTEILFVLLLGLLVLGPKRLHAMLGQLARAKAEFENAARGIKTQLAAELDASSVDEKTEGSPELAEEQYAVRDTVLHSLPAWVKAEDLDDCANERYQTDT